MGNTQHSPDEQGRNREAFDILVRQELQNATEEMKVYEREFVEGLAGRFDSYGERTYVSPKQLSWLRDLAGKYL